tara:strand:+ start:254 stop:700 length:447 start_codon:yes stop_codon:yes gene_type:complete
MQIILLESLTKLGKAGEIVNVKDGFAKNYLIPQKKAIVANKKNKLNLADKMSQISENNQIKIEEAENLKSKIEGKTIKIDMEANDDGKLYGAINQKFIVEQVKQSLSIELHAESIILYPIKSIGDYEIKLRLYEEIQASIRLEISKKA